MAWMGIARLQLVVFCWWMPVFRHDPCRRVSAGGKVLGKLFTVASLLLPLFVPFVRLWVGNDRKAALPVSCFHSRPRGWGSAQAAHVGILLHLHFLPLETRFPLLAVCRFLPGCPRVTSSELTQQSVTSSPFFLQFPLISSRNCTYHIDWIQWLTSTVRCTLQHARFRRSTMHKDGSPPPMSLSF